MDKTSSMYLYVKLNQDANCFTGEVKPVNER